MYTNGRRKETINKVVLKVLYKSNYTSDVNPDAHALSLLE